MQTIISACQLKAVSVAEEAHRKPEGLIQTLFADHATIYALLDANNIPNLPSLLEASDLPHRCMFQGDLRVTAQDVAPWLVQLTRDAKLTSQLLSDPITKTYPISYWDKYPGIFLRSSMDIDDLKRHLRRFLRIQDQHGKKFFFRFWEPDMAVTYFSALNDRPELIERWFRSREGGTIDALIAPDPTVASNKTPPEVVIFEPMDLHNSPARHFGIFTLSDEDMSRFQRRLLDRDIADIIQRVDQTFPEITKQMTFEEYDRTARRTLSRMVEFNFRQKPTLLTLLAWELNFGPNFEKNDPEGILFSIFKSNEDEAERFEKVQIRLRELDLN